jgi:hypothetical protein
MDGQPPPQMNTSAQAPAPARLQAGQPVELVAAVRAAQRPPDVERSEHPLLLAGERSHLYPLYRPRILLDLKAPATGPPSPSLSPPAPVRMGGSRTPADRYINQVLYAMSSSRALLGGSVQLLRGVLSAPQKIPEGSPRRTSAAHAVDAPAWRGRGGAQVKTAEWRVVGAQGDSRTKNGLTQRRRSAVDVPAHVVGIALR